MRFFTALIGGAVVLATIGAATAPKLAPVHATAQQLTISASSSAAQKLFTWGDSAPGTSSNAFTAPSPLPVNETPIVVIPPPELPAKGPCSPRITKAKGKLTSEGYLVLEGTCFGPNGSLSLGGFGSTYPEPGPKMTIEAWTPTAITAQFPKIFGVPDLTMHIKVVSGALTSQSIDATYVAALGGPLPLPNKDVVNNVCTLYGVCTAAPHIAIGAHWDYSEQTGSDVWTIKVPEHFHLHSILITQLTPAPSTTSTIVASSSETTFKVSWREKQNLSVPGTASETITTSCPDQFGSILVGLATAGVGSVAGGANGCNTTTTGGQAIEIPAYSNFYRVQPLVVGPIGMIPGQ